MGEGVTEFDGEEVVDTIEGRLITNAGAGFSGDLVGADYCNKEEK